MKQDFPLYPGYPTSSPGGGDAFVLEVKTTAFTITAADNGKTIIADYTGGGYDIGYDSAADLGADFHCTIVPNAPGAGGNVTITALDGYESISIINGGMIYLYSDGTTRYLSYPVGNLRNGGILEYYGFRTFGQFNVGTFGNRSSGYYIDYNSITNGTGDPEGVAGALNGSLYFRTDGGAGTSLYAKQFYNTGTEGWAPIIPQQIVTKTADFNLDASHNGAVIFAYIDAGYTTATIPDAATLGPNFSCTILVTSTAPTSFQFWTSDTPSYRLITGSVVKVYCDGTTVFVDSKGKIDADGASISVPGSITAGDIIITTGVIAAGTSFLFSGTNIYDTFGSGSPEGVVLADRGSTYRRTDGGAGTCIYVKESGDGLNTGWVAK